MGVYQGKDFKKISGGKKRSHRDARKYELGSYPTETLLSTKDLKVADRCRGGNKKIRLKYVAHANVLDPTSKTYKKVRIFSVVETPPNRDYARRGIIVKGAIIQTELGRARVVSRPGQDGVVNAVLLK